MFQQRQPLFPWVTPQRQPPQEPMSDSNSQLESDMSSLSAERIGQPGFSICFDNVNQKTTVTHQTRERKNKIFNMVQAYAALDRINTLQLSDEMPTPEDISSIPLEKILPCEMDEIDLRSEMTVMVERILCSRIPSFLDLADKVTWHMNHQYSEQSSRKSEMVLLGVLDKDESKISDTICILEEYHKYVPFKPDGSPVILPLHADGLSCERVNDSHNARMNGTTPWTQLQGLIPNIQEWHKRCLLLQDIYDDLFSGKSAREKGTLFHLKNYFEQRNVTGNVKESFNYNEDFLQFCTEGYITVLAMTILDLSEINETPDSFSAMDPIHVLHDTASKVMDEVFQSAIPTVNQILRPNESTDDGYRYCICKTERPGELMVFCDNRNCCRGVWFHLDCVELEEDDVPEGPWYCSDQCQKQKAKRKSRKKTVAENLKDGKKDYALLLIWKGLSQMVRKDAIRENNGRMIITHWKFDLLQFYAKHHPKYFLICTRLLLACCGGVSERLRHTLTWNRTVNVNGGLGRNIAMDLQMEYFNRDYKESVKDAAGQLTENTVARHSQMIGVGKQLDKVYDIQLCGLSGRNVHKSGDSDQQRKKDFEEFLNLIVPEDIFTSHSGRTHKSFSDLDANVFSGAVPRLINARLERIRKEESKKRKTRDMMLDTEEI